MLYIVLILVLAALGLVVTALITANSLWAWISIGLSVLAGVLLVTDWLRRRSRSTTAPAADGEAEEADEADKADEAAEAKAEDGEPETGDTGDTAETGTEAEKAEQKAPTEGQTALLPASGELKTPSGDPAEEQTDAADLLVVSELSTEVLVVDEYPRYHLAECSWLADKDTIPLPAKEARDLGFTPCALCGPDAKLAAEHRDKKKSKKGS